MRNHQIHGMSMRPVSLTEEDNKKKVMGSTSAKTKDFLDEYNNRIAEMQIISECAKIFIMDNWKVIDDWSDIDIVIRHTIGKERKTSSYYKYQEDTCWSDNNSAQSIKKIFDNHNKERHNPMPQVKECVLDSTDGDFSVNLVDGTELWWIDDEAVIIIADYIESKIKTIKKLVYKLNFFFI